MDAIKLSGNVEVMLTGHTLTVYDYDNGRERDYTWSVELDDDQCGAILAELLCTEAVIGARLEDAFECGLRVGRAEAEFATTTDKEFTA